MGNLTKLLSGTESETIKAIYAQWKEAGDSEPFRRYLGASIIGHPCERYLWYVFRHCCQPSFDGRMYRLFDRGDCEEPRMASDLSAIGCEVHVTDENCNQFAVAAFGGHFRGHLDGCARGILEAPKTWHVLEFKTHNAKHFRELVKKGVQVAQPKHYAQVMIEMHLTGMKRALYLAVNKDTEELYSERIRYDRAQGEELIAKAGRIIMSASPPDRIGDKPDYYECRYCDAKDICYGSQPPKPALPIPWLSCRQCCHATPCLNGVDGRWRCEKRGKSLSERDQDNPCDDQLVIPDLLVNVSPVNHGKDAAGNDYVRFRDDLWDEWKHGKGGGMHSSEDLTVLPYPLLGNGMIQTAKEKFNAKPLPEKDDILGRFPEEETRIVWRGGLEFVKIAYAWKQKYNEELFDLRSIAKCNFDGMSLAEYKGGRAVVAYPQNKVAEIWERVPSIESQQIEAKTDAPPKE